ncbi:MAG: hypothetical protein KGZ65_09275 [Sphingomonadales bacterium]|nr:hypothetical protein [Sphingomonadaceae bacterium]MBS3931414.1 hypothetical protein [Sphingomonadales bacterium]
MLRRTNYWKDIKPTGALSDLVTVFRQAGSARWTNAVIAGALTFGVFSIMTAQSWKVERKLPTVTYINSWPADRTAEETRDFILRNQKEKEEYEARQAAADAEAQRLWMAVGKASGMDVKEMKARADAEKAQEKAKAEAEAKKALEQVKIEN